MSWDQLSLREKLEFLQSLPEDKKLAILPELVALYELRESNPLMFFEPYEQQSHFLSSNEATKVFVGGNRAGKTTIGIIDDLIQCVDRDSLPENLLKFKRWDAPFYCRIVFPNFGQGEMVVMEKLREYCPKDQLVGDSFDKAYQKMPVRKLKFKNGSWIVFNTADQNPEDHAGIKLHRVHFDEEPIGQRGLTIYEENKVRLWDYAPKSQMMFTMTPSLDGGGMTWTYDELWERRNEAGVKLIQVSSLDNPHNPKDIIMADAAKWSDEERRARIDGEFVAMRGLVFDRFSDEHIVDQPPRKHVQDLQVVVGIDPGITQGGVIWAGFDKDNHMLVFDELYPRDKGIKEIAEEIKVKNKLWGIEPAYVIDPSARNRSLVNAESVQGEFYRQGIFPIPGQNDRLASVLQLRSRIDHNSLSISSNCRDLLGEMRRWAIAKDEDSEKYSAKVKGAGGTFATIGPDHLIDPVRYVAMSRLWYVKPKEDKSKILPWNVVPNIEDEIVHNDFYDY